MTERRDLPRDGAGPEEMSLTARDAARLVTRRKPRVAIAAFASLAVAAIVGGTIWRLADDPAGVTAVTGPGASGPPSVVGTWELAGLSDVTAFGDQPVRITFRPGGAIELDTGCNLAGGSWAQRGGSVEVALRFTTAAGCRGAAGDVERSVAERLGRPLSVSRFGGLEDTIQLSAANGFLLFGPTRADVPRDTAPSSSTVPASIPSGQATGHSCDESAIYAAVLADLHRSPQVTITGVVVGRCGGGYARVSVIPDQSGCGRAGGSCFDAEQVFLREVDGAWKVIASGTGITCVDTDLTVDLRAACAALVPPGTP